MTGDLAYEDLQRRVEDLEGKLAYRERGHDLLQQYTLYLKFLSGTSTEFVELPPEENIYRLIGERLKELVGDCVVAINSYDRATDSICTRAVAGLGKYTQTVLKLIGKDPVGMSFPINNEEARRQLHSGRLVLGPQGLYDLTFGRIPEGVCHKIEVVLGLHEIYAVGFVSKGQLFGTAIIITRKGRSGLKMKDVVETFIHQAAVALQRREAEEALLKARDELEKRVEERTAQLARSNEQLRREVEERKLAEKALREREESYRHLVENANDLIYKTDPMGNFTFFNAIAVKTTEYPAEYLLGRNYLELIRKDYRRDAEKFYTAQSVERIPSTYYEFPMITESGKEVWLGQHVQLILEKDDIVGFHAVARDITERRRVEEALRESEERYRQLVKHAPAAIFEYDLETKKLVALNDVLYQFLGYTKEEMEALEPIDFLAEESQRLYQERLGKVLAGEEILDTVEYRVRGKGGRELWAHVNTRLVRERGKIRRVTSVVHDITELKRAEEALRDSEKRLRTLSSQLIKAQEKERMRLSKELHDELGQGLALLKHRMRSIQGKLQEGQSALQTECDETNRYIDSIIENVRRLSRDLSPSILEDLGLTAALRWLVENFTRQYALETSFDIENVDSLFSREAQTNLYRISQEALNNIGKHAEATRVSFALNRNEDDLYLVVEDDGKGFDLKKIKARYSLEKGLGLDAMEERAHMLGASLSISSHVGEGTKVTLTIPVEEEGVK